MLRPLCVHSASAGTCSCVRPAGALRPVCVSAGVDAVTRFLFVDRRKISRFAFHLRNVGVGIRFHASDFNHLTRVSRIVYQWQQQKTFFYKFSDGKAFPICKKSSNFVENGKYFYSEYKNQHTFGLTSQLSIAHFVSVASIVSHGGLSYGFSVYQMSILQL